MICQVDMLDLLVAELSVPGEGIRSIYVYGMGATDLYAVIS